MTSVANQPSRRFGADAPPLPFAPTLGTRSPAAFTPSPNHALNRLPAPFARSTAATSHASPRYRGLEHTLGPTFSEEEDGDDSAFIASKMAVLGLDPNGVPYRGDFASSSVSLPGGALLMKALQQWYF